MQNIFDNVYLNDLLGTLIDNKQFSSENLNCIKAYLFLNPKSSRFGSIICIFIYNNIIYRSLFNILSNQLTQIEAVNRITDYVFWRDALYITDIPDKKLESEGDKELRLFIRKLMLYSKNNNLRSYIKRLKE